MEDLHPASRALMTLFSEWYGMTDSEKDQVLKELDAQWCPKSQILAHLQTITLEVQELV